MKESNILKLFKWANKSRVIAGKAGLDMIGLSLSTSKKLAKLYKDAGYRSLDLSLDVAKKTRKLLLDHQQELWGTSGNALKKIVKQFKEEEEMVEISVNRKKGKRGHAKKILKAKSEVTIDDMIS